MSQTIRITSLFRLVNIPKKTKKMCLILTKLLPMKVKITPSSNPSYLGMGNFSDLPFEISSWYVWFGTPCIQSLPSRTLQPGRCPPNIGLILDTNIAWILTCKANLEWANAFIQYSWNIANYIALILFWILGDIRNQIPFQYWKSMLAQYWLHIWLSLWIKHLYYMFSQYH